MLLATASYVRRKAAIRSAFTCSKARVASLASCRLLPRVASVFARRSDADARRTPAFMFGAILPICASTPFARSTNSFSSFLYLALPGPSFAILARGTDDRSTCSALSASTSSCDDVVDSSPACDDETDAPRRAARRRPCEACDDDIISSSSSSSICEAWEARDICDCDCDAASSAGIGGTRGLSSPTSGSATSSSRASCRMEWRICRFASNFDSTSATRLRSPPASRTADVTFDLSCFTRWFSSTSASDDAPSTVACFLAVSFSALAAFSIFESSAFSFLISASSDATSLAARSAAADTSRALSSASLPLASSMARVSCTVRRS
mmetsp:Transcript_13954/g.43934  ORF Transcript_13954/g.43934 Transcript_13954/m.43934 type:complete len:325 (+) Transcript_13954:479-1453(+)